MRFVCDAPGGTTWFRIDTEAEAAAESDLMRHAVEKHFRQERDKARATFRPLSTVSFEQEIGLGAHLREEMPIFLTLRDGEGNGLVTAMLPPRGEESAAFRPIVVGPGNSDPYPVHAPAIEALGRQFGLRLDRTRCYPYRR